MCEPEADPTNPPESSGDEEFTDIECLSYALTDEGRDALVEEGRYLLTRDARAEKIREGGGRPLVVCGRWTGSSQVPYLRISGQWFREAGFEVGTLVAVEVKDCQLVVSVA